MSDLDGDRHGLSEPERRKLLDILACERAGTVTSRPKFASAIEPIVEEFHVSRAAYNEPHKDESTRQNARCEAAQAIVKACETMCKQIKRYRRNTGHEEARAILDAEIEQVSEMLAIWRDRRDQYIADPVGPDRTIDIGKWPSWLVVNRALSSGADQENILSPRSLLAGIDDEVEIAAMDEMVDPVSRKKGGRMTPMFRIRFALRVAAAWKRVFGEDPGHYRKSKFIRVYGGLCDLIGEKPVSPDTLGPLFKAVPVQHGGPFLPRPRGRPTKKG
ncbi:hypothetical protein [Minwuia sp. IMCC3009]|uniref:hypothetical protein n=1 Tax=Minwuia sp. IMCC3009 TaxID=3040674 RepID=UPI002478B96E|nr:hypothetical protein [Minwuia sp. IMCC3009]